MKNKFLSKLISFILVLCIAFSCTAIYAEGNIILSDVAHKYFKIGLSYASSAVDMVKLESSEGFLQVDCAYEGWGAVRDLTAYKELYVIYYEEYDAPVVMDLDGTICYPVPEGQALIGASTSLDSQFIKINDKTYRDGVCFTLNEDNSINVINYIELEHYLWGVMKNEIGDQYPSEALKAFAVTTRSFACAHRGSHSKYGFDLCSGGDCQMYRGVSAERSVCTAAYKETIGIVMTYDGEIISGNHYANSGGHTLNSEDAWVSAVPYLRAVEDPYSPECTWDVSYTYAQVKDKLLAQGIDVGDVYKVEISSATDYGAVLELSITGSSGSAVLSKSKIKTCFSLKSQLFTLSSDIAAEAESESNAEEGYIYVIGAGGIPEKMRSDELVVFDGEKTSSGAELDWSGFSFVADVNASPEDTLTFHGKGSGHGVGMSQSGINVMAQQGFTYDEILKFYFTGINIEKK